MLYTACERACYFVMSLLRLCTRIPNNYSGIYVYVYIYLAIVCLVLKIEKVFLKRGIKQQQ